MKASHWIFIKMVVALILAQLVVLVLSAQTAKLEQIHVLTLVGRPLPVIVGEKRGTFAKFGIEVTTENCASSDLMRAALAAGKGDLAYAAVDNAVAMVEIAGVDVVIVSGGEGSQNELIAQPDIKSIKGLQGKTLLVDAPNTAYALQLKKIMLLSGMQAGRDYEMKPYGATPLRLEALLKHSEFAGSMLGAPASLSGKSAGLVSLGSIPDLLGAYQAGGHFARRKWADEHRESMVKYLAAYVESQRWVMDPANKKPSIGNHGRQIDEPESGIWPAGIGCSLPLFARPFGFMSVPCGCLFEAFQGRQPPKWISQPSSARRVAHRDCAG